ncbi:MAG: M12 family metallo-peptidase [Bacteroidota bacterium]|nr:M12 family metallo-peptidase [Bacteroidota bacterium]
MKSIIQCPGFSRKCSLLSLALFGSIFFTQKIEAQVADPFGVYETWTQSEPKSLPKIILSRQGYSSQEELNQRFQLSKYELRAWKQLNHDFIKTTIPLASGKKLNLILKKFEPLEDRKNIFDLTDETILSVPLTDGHFFQGHLEKDPNSMVSLSLFENEIYGLIIDGDGHTYSILPSKISNESLIYFDLVEESKNHTDITLPACSTDDQAHYFENQHQITQRSRDNCKRVSISLRLDFDLYKKQGSSVTKSVNYAIALFNNVQAIYRKEDIQISLAEITVHTTADGFKHISASEDLSFFRKKYPTYKGNIHLLLSGFSISGAPKLGGIAYINSFCTKSYSFAFANVIGTYSEYPIYSWDVFVCAHELGHVLGSRHTHACVWGPNKNQAIDNCGSLEGTCTKPGIPIKGTLMSYCYTSANPGVDLSLGFGIEPGNLIRSNIQSSTCLSNYLPQNKLPTKSDQHITANHECFDGVYTNYYFDNFTVNDTDDILILSIKKTSEPIGFISDGSLIIRAHNTKSFGTNQPTPITASYVGIGEKLFVVNKYWEILPAKKITQSITVKFAFSDQDLTDLKGKIPNLKVDQLNVFSFTDAVNPNPVTNHEGATIFNTTKYKYSLKAGAGNWVYSIDPNGKHNVETELKHLAGISMGAYIEFSALTSSFELGTFRAQKSGADNLIEWSSLSEKHTKKFILEKSLNGIKFDSITTINAAGTSSVLKSYSYIDKKMAAGENYYRLRIVDTYGGFWNSIVVSLSSSYSYANRVNLYPNPVPDGFLFVEFNSLIAGPATFEILDLTGLKLSSKTESIQKSKNIIQVETSQLKNGFYYLRIISGAESLKQKFVVKKF